MTKFETSDATARCCHYCNATGADMTLPFSNAEILSCRDCCQSILEQILPQIPVQAIGCIPQVLLSDSLTSFTDSSWH